ncbi:DedA family protein [Helicobacter sp. 13S00401-1]|uniref:DedA family protein n=1 Tax=Helicobacter sp. 13S00401-1 TaxID=1905758 RepID=UPI001555E3A4|nr:DedA family protein [Helicobacter sp. 13S00401-1]
MASILHFIVNTIDTLGYIGIFILMAIESSFIPLPSEVVMIPAGYLVYQGRMDMSLVILAGTLGSLAGALINYYIALKFGRLIVLKYGKYFLMKESTLLKTENFFKKHGPISTFIGRLLPLIRHYISLPAGLARMSLWKFCLYTLLGALVWVAVLSYFGFYLGSSLGDTQSINEIAGAFMGSSKDSLQLDIKSQVKNIMLVIIAAVIVIGIVYSIISKFKKSK